MADTWAGIRPQRAAFQRRGDDEGDGWGGTIPGTGPFETQFEHTAWMRPLRGTESVQAARLAGRQPFAVRVRKNSQTEQITTAWQLVDARDESRVFAVTSPPADPDGKNAWLEFICVEGGLS